MAVYLDEITSTDELVQARCQLARDSEGSGEFRQAAQILGKYWQGVGAKPDTRNLSRLSTAEVLMRAGVVSGFIGSAESIANSQEAARDLISESLFIFSDLGLFNKVAEAQIEIAACYWREGSFNEARDCLQDAISKLADTDRSLKTLAVVRLGLVEAAASRPHSSLAIFKEHYLLCVSCNDTALKGKFHNHFGATLYHLGEEEKNLEYTKRAIIEFREARKYFDELQNYTLSACAYNNEAMALTTLGECAQAHDCLDRARPVFLSRNHKTKVCSLDDSRARVYLAQGLNDLAAKVCADNIAALEVTDHKGLLLEAYLTYGIALARLHDLVDARFCFNRAAELAEFTGDLDALKKISEARNNELPEGEAKRVVQFPLNRVRKLLYYRIPDDSLSGVDIFAGDVIKCADESRWNNGDLVIVSTPDGIFCKFIYAETDSIVRLEGAHDRCRARLYNEGEIRILGISKP